MFYNDDYIKEHELFFKQLFGGFQKSLILWIISKEPIHGYGIMKKLDQFFEVQIKKGVMKKATNSKIYPLLNQMEEHNLIKGVVGTHNNREVKIYEITSRGEEVVAHIKKTWENLLKNELWYAFFMDIAPKNIFL